MAVYANCKNNIIKEIVVLPIMEIKTYTRHKMLGFDIKCNIAGGQ